MNLGFQGGTVRLDRIPEGLGATESHRSSILENRNSQSRELTDISDNSPPEPTSFRLSPTIRKLRDAVGNPNAVVVRKNATRRSLPNA